jgi:hypothetical protein
MYVVDSRTQDSTRDVLEKHGMDFIEITPEFDRVEDIVWRIGENSDTTWLLRIDDDELPACEMFEWIESTLSQLAASSVSFSRRWCMADAEGQLCYARAERYYWFSRRPDMLDPQPRLFRPANAIWEREIHTAGFKADGPAFAPTSAYICHFDWVVRDLASRLRKIRNYDAQRAGAGTFNAHFYLPECLDATQIRLTRFETTQFNELMQELLEFAQS